MGPSWRLMTGVHGLMKFRQVASTYVKPQGGHACMPAPLAGQNVGQFVGSVSMLASNPGPRHHRICHLGLFTTVEHIQEVIGTWVRGYAGA